MVVVIGYCPVDGLLRADSALVVGIGNVVRSVPRHIGQRRDIVARKPDLSACQSAERVIIKA